MNIELTRFRVREGARETVRQWMDFLNENKPAVLETLEPERMYVETIFSETVEDVDYLYWFSVQGEGGAPVDKSTHWIDLRHMEFWDACIDEDFPPQDLTPEVLMVPERVLAAMTPLADAGLNERAPESRG